MEDNGLLFKNESFSIIGAALEVHKVLGCGFIEVVYQEALEEEFKKAVLQFTDDHYAQLYSYLKASNLPLGILINFGKANLDYYRLPASKKWQNNNYGNG